MDMIEKELQLTNCTSENQCFLAKLALALTIPSFCSKFIFENDPGKGYKQNESDRYPQWCDEYLDFTALDAKECYAARCSILHHGDDNLQTQSVLKEGYSMSNYRLTIPYTDNNISLTKQQGDGVEEKFFCSNGLIVSLLDAYQKFRKDYPSFIYPLQKKD